MKKMVSKRIKVTKKGKVLRRAMGIGHFRAKKSASALRRKSGYRTLEGNKNIKKIIK